MDFTAALTWGVIVASTVFSAIAIINRHNRRNRGLVKAWDSDPIQSASISGFRVHSASSLILHPTTPPTRSEIQVLRSQSGPSPLQFLRANSQDCSEYFYSEEDREAFAKILKDGIVPENLGIAKAILESFPESFFGNYAAPEAWEVSSDNRRRKAFIGFRAWYVVESKASTVLLLESMGTMAFWEPSGPTRAHCTHLSTVRLENDLGFVKSADAIKAMHGPSPNPYCECGLYAMWNPEKLKSYVRFADRGGKIVVGLVMGWGNVVEHPGEGFRSEYAKPIAFFSDIPRDMEAVKNVGILNAETLRAKYAPRIEIVRRLCDQYQLSYDPLSVYDDKAIKWIEEEFAA